MIRKTVKSVFAAAVVLALATCAFADDFARIGTSSVGGGFYLIGNTIAQVGNAANNGVNYTAVTGGSTKNLNALEIASLGASMIDQVRTNMEINDIINVAIVVAGNGIGGFETLQLPVNGTYKQETRNDEAMLYDCDFAANSTQLYNFIYE